jgi:hypothetical protein
MTDYLEKFIIKQIKHYIPEGIDPILHINCRAHMFEIISNLIKEKKIPPKLAVIKYLCLNYKQMIYQKLSVLN